MFVVPLFTKSTITDAQKGQTEGCTFFIVFKANSQSDLFQSDLFLQNVCPCKATVGAHRM